MRNPISVKADKYELSYIASRICQPDYVNEVSEKLSLNSLERERLQFCLFCYGISSVVWWLDSYFRGVGVDTPNDVKRLIDDFYALIIEKAEEFMDSSVVVNKFLLDKEELNGFVNKHNTVPTVETSLATILSTIALDRIALFSNAFDVQIKDAFKAKQDKEYFALPPVSKLFMQLFYGDWQHRADLLIPIAAFLQTCHHQIGDCLKPRIEFC